MTAKEKDKIVKCINLLIEDDCNFEDAMELLCGMVGYTYPASKLKDIKTISIADAIRLKEDEK